MSEPVERPAPKRFRGRCTTCTARAYATEQEGHTDRGRASNWEWDFFFVQCGCGLFVVDGHKVKAALDTKPGEQSA